MIADWSSDEDVMNIAAQPIPFKILLHPLRKEFGGPGLNEPLFQTTVQTCAENSKQYGKGTAIKAWLHQRLQANFSKAFPDRAKAKHHDTPDILCRRPEPVYSRL